MSLQGVGRIQLQWVFSTKNTLLISQEYTIWVYIFIFCCSNYPSSFWHSKDIASVFF